MTKAQERLLEKGYKRKGVYRTPQVAKGEQSRWKSRQGGGYAQIITTSDIFGTDYHLYVKRKDDIQRTGSEKRR